MEQLGQKILLEIPPENEDKSFEGKEKRRVKPLRQDSFVSARDDGKAAVLQRRINVLDECLQNSADDLDTVEREIERKRGSSGLDMDQLLKQRQNLIQAIEAMQVQYVALSVELEEM
jgi:hypothetical protein